MSIKTLFTNQGFDICEEFNTSVYNVAILKLGHKELTLPDAKKAILVGNTGRLWDFFIRHLAEQKDIKTQNPFDEWVQATISGICEKQSATISGICEKQSARISGICEKQNACEIRWVTDTKIGRKFSAQHLTAAIGLAALEPSLGLNVHPIYGPWFALRAVILFLNETTQMMTTGEIVGTPTCARPCEVAGCVEAQEKAMQKREDVAGWKKWLNVRDSCLVGRKYRYCEEQIIYHYTHSKEILQQAVQRQKITQK